MEDWRIGERKKPAYFLFSLFWMVSPTLTLSSPLFHFPPDRPSLHGPICCWEPLHRSSSWPLVTTPPPFSRFTSITGGSDFLLLLISGWPHHPLFGFQIFQRLLLLSPCIKGLLFDNWAMTNAVSSHIFNLDYALPDACPTNSAPYPTLSLGPSSPMGSPVHIRVFSSYPSVINQFSYQPMQLCPDSSPSPDHPDLILS